MYERLASTEVDLNRSSWSFRIRIWLAEVARLRMILRSVGNCAEVRDGWY